MIRPFLRYVGGKTRYAKQIIGEFPEDMKEYREPMVGGGGMVIYLAQVWREPLKIEIGDADPKIAELWGAVLDENEDLREKLELGVQSLPDESTRVNRAVRAIIENRMREFGNHGRRELDMNVVKKDLEMVKKRIFGIGELLVFTRVTCRDYKWALREENKDCVVFLDPPYMEVQDKKGYYYKHKQFDYDELLRELEMTKNRFIMTIDEAFIERMGIHKFMVKELEVLPTMGGKKKTEFIVKNF